jgi:hypothetical protein
MLLLFSRSCSVLYFGLFCLQDTVNGTSVNRVSCRKGSAYFYFSLASLNEQFIEIQASYISFVIMPYSILVCCCSMDMLELANDLVKSLIVLSLIFTL